MKGVGKMKEIVINNKYGGFGLSYKGTMRYAELRGIKLYFYIDEISKKIWRQYHKEELTVEIMDREKFGCIHYCTKHPINNKVLNKFYFSDRDIKRDDTVLIQVVKELHKEANGHHADLKIVKIPNDVKWTIEEYDGNEWIAEEHRTWR